MRDEEYQNKETRSENKDKKRKTNKFCKLDGSLPHGAFLFLLSNIRANEHMPMSIVWTPNEATRHTVCLLIRGMKKKEE